MPRAREKFETFRAMSFTRPISRAWSSAVASSFTCETILIGLRYREGALALANPSKGSCMFLHGPLWDAGCDASYSDNIPFFAGALDQCAGDAAPSRIECERKSHRAAADNEHGGFKRISLRTRCHFHYLGHRSYQTAARIRSRRTDSLASRTTCRGSSAMNSPPRRRTRPSTITVSMFEGCAE